MLLLRLSALGCCAAALGGCIDSVENFGGTPAPTLIAASPEDFLGGLACDEGQGAPVRYVTTLLEASSDDPLTLPSSGPVSCQQNVSFQRIVPGMNYTAEIDVYDRDDLRAVAPGVREMVDSGTGAYVAPAWTTCCGQACGQASTTQPRPTRAVGNRTIFLRDCASIQPRAEQPTGLTVRLTDLGCGDADAPIDRLLVSGAGQKWEVACGSNVTADDLVGGRNYEFSVQAFGPDSSTSPVQGTVCRGTTSPGVIGTAGCDSLRSDGAVRFDLERDVGTLCTVIDTLTLQVEHASTVELKTVEQCGIVTLGGLTAGPYSATLLTTVSAGGQSAQGPTLVCGGVVKPGLTVEATCVRAEGT